MSSSVEPVTGALFVEVFVAVLLYGVATTQAYMYWWRYPGDASLTRKTVLTVWFLETVHTAFCLDLIYNYAILDYNNLGRIYTIAWSVGACVVVGVIIAAIVQSFFINRIWILSKRNVFITATPLVFLFCEVGFGIATASITWRLNSWQRYRPAIVPLVTLTSGLSLSATVDFIIAAALIFYLQQGRTSSRQTNHVIKFVQVYLINTGALTMLMSLAIVLTFVLMKNSLLFVGLFTIQSKLYANSFLATLNARQHWTPTGRRGGEDGVVSMNISPSLPNGPPQRFAARRIEIFQTVTQVTEVFDDSTQPKHPAAIAALENVDEEDSATAKSQVLL